MNKILAKFAHAMRCVASIDAEFPNVRLNFATLLDLPQRNDGFGPGNRSVTDATAKEIVMNGKSALPGT